MSEPRTLPEALARIAELDAEVTHWVQTYERLADEQGEVDAIRIAADDALRPPCLTCGGKGVVVTPESVGAAFFAVMDKGKGAGVPHLICPDCVDGKVSIEQLAATWRAVFAEDFEADSMWNAVAYLRSVRP